MIDLIIGFILVFVLGMVAGAYTVTQIEKSIDKNIKDE